MSWQFELGGALPGTQTVTVVYAMFASDKPAGPESTISGATLFAAELGLTVTEAEPDFVVSCVDVAVIVASRLAVTVGAVNSPDEEMEPADALQVTLWLKLPVPETVAEH